MVHRDPRDRRFVFFQDPHTHVWHALGWTGLPPDGELPAFSDARAQELLGEARRRGLKPRSDAELRPVLLDLLAGHAPVAQWPTQQRPKRRRTARAREAAQTTAAARDRPRHGKDEGEGTPAQPLAANVVPFDPDGHARQVQDAIDAERRRRREQAVPVTPPPPPRLGETYRRSSLLALPPEDAEELPTEPASSGSASRQDRR